MRAAIGLQIQPDDFHSTYLQNTFRQKIDLGADQIWDLERLFPRENLDSNLTGLCHLMVDRHLDLADEFSAHGLEFKIHASLEWVHIATGNFRPIIAEDRSTQDVHG